MIILGSWRISKLGWFAPPIKITMGCQGVWKWETGGNGVFFVKSCYVKLLVREEIVFPHTSIWIPRVSRKVCCFTWLATRGVILTAENLRKRKITCVSWCFMCKESGERRRSPTLTLPGRIFIMGAVGEMVWF